MVTPVVLYGSEIWCHEGCEILEKLHLQFYKIILCWKKSTCNIMVYGELGRYPLLIAAKMRILSFWARLMFYVQMIIMLRVIKQHSIQLNKHTLTFNQEVDSRPKIQGVRYSKTKFSFFFCGD